MVFFEKKSIKYSLFIGFFVSIIALIFAYSSEYFLGLEPCQLCRYQRYGYWLIMGITLFPLLMPQLDRYCMFFLIISVLSVIMVALYQVGIEKGFFTPTKNCLVNSTAKTIEDLKSQLQMGVCQKPQWHFLGFSMAFWNAFYAFAFFILIFLMPFLRKKLSTR